MFYVNTELMLRSQIKSACVLSLSVIPALRCGLSVVNNLLFSYKYCLRLASYCKRLVHFAQTRNISHNTPRDY